MPSRRTFLAGAGTALLPLGSGCLGSLAGGADPAGSGAGTPASEFTPRQPPSGIFIDLPDGPRSLPELPDDLSRRSVDRFALEAERAIAYNSVDCDHGGGDVYVEANDPNAYAIRDGLFRARGNAIGSSSCDGGKYTETGQAFYTDSNYLVTEEYASRVPEGEKISGNTGGLEALLGTTPIERVAFYVMNFDDRSHEISVTIKNGDEIEFRRDFGMNPRTKVWVTNAVHTRGHHQVTVETDAGANSSDRWTVPNHGPGLPELVIVLPTGEVIANG